MQKKWRHKTLNIFIKRNKGIELPKIFISGMRKQISENNLAPITTSRLLGLNYSFSTLIINTLYPLLEKYQ